MKLEEKILMSKLFLCGIAFQHELGETDEIDIYNSLEDCKKGHSCWKECGIVAIEVKDEKKPEKYSSSEWIVEQDLYWRKK